MKSVDCDQVFDILTRGPFPAGEPSDRAVERHLACCHECRSLAEALRPAVELFHEAIEPEEGRDLPGYHGALAPAARGVAQMVAAAIAAEEPLVRRPLPQVQSQRATWWETYIESPWRYAGAIAMGALLALLLWGVAPEFQHSAPLASMPVPAGPTEDGLLQLASLRLPAGCFTSHTHAIHCCTECHAAKGTAQPANSRVLLAMVTSCRSCHP
ncbi:MAG TPA: hypothetical protein VL096_01985 [Pirellulaceae bacterium]|nr:hypothetical protein [Pirellulaceae bacterium]